MAIMLPRLSEQTTRCSIAWHLSRTSGGRSAFAPALLDDGPAHLIPYRAKGSLLSWLVRSREWVASASPAFGALGHKMWWPVRSTGEA